MANETYYGRYKELIGIYKIGFGDCTNADDYDVIIKCVGYGYAHTKYRVIKNAPELSTQDLAILCDRGNVCFGYRTEGGCICIHTD